MISEKEFSLINRRIKKNQSRKREILINHISIIVVASLTLALALFKWNNTVDYLGLRWTIVLSIMVVSFCASVTVLSAIGYLKKRMSISKELIADLDVANSVLKVTNEYLNSILSALVKVKQSVYESNNRSDYDEAFRVLCETRSKLISANQEPKFIEKEYDYLLNEYMDSTGFVFRSFLRFFKNNLDQISNDWVMESIKLMSDLV